MTLVTAHSKWLLPIFKMYLAASTEEMRSKGVIHWGCYWFGVVWFWRKSCNGTNEKRQWVYFLLNQVGDSPIYPGYVLDVHL